ncbi:MAG TPA: alpha/beta fold hydrolase [Solirubrobacteraceae bacterium]|nr:alpha/beta fold hydrolase [Solirubrobacteraceae bacterium]
MTGKDHRRALWTAAGTAGALAAGGVLQAGHMRRIAHDPEKEELEHAPTGRVQRVRSVDGTVLHVEVFGPEDGDTVVLAHGWTEALRFWTYVIRGLVHHGLRVVAYDLRGHGESDPAKNDDYAIPRFGEDVEAVLAACVPDADRAVITGHSLGAMSIVSWAQKHDVHRHVRAAALLNTGVENLINDNLLLPLPGIANALHRTIALHGFLGARAPLPRFSTPLSAASIRYIAFGPHASPAQVAFFERMLVTCPPDVRARVGIAMSDMDLQGALPRLTVPTIVIAGADDKLTPPSHARRIAEMLPDLRRLIVLEDTGHMTPLERPEVVIDVLRDLAALKTERAAA